MIERCPWCKADVEPHCKNGHPTCHWAKCPDCGIAIDPESKRAYNRRAQQIEWPKVQPDDRGNE